MSYRRLLAGHAEGVALDRLVSYAELLERWASRHSLVRFGSPEELVERHLLDALAGVRWVPAGARLADIGSGAGLPGIPLLCAVEGASGVLVEPRSKRWAFLRTAVRTLELDAEVVCARMADLGETWSGLTRVTARALGRHEELLGWARNRLAKDGAVLLWVTVNEVQRLERLPTWRVLSCALPRSDRGRLALVQPCFT